MMRRLWTPVFFQLAEQIQEKLPDHQYSRWWIKYAVIMGSRDQLHPTPQDKVHLPTLESELNLINPQVNTTIHTDNIIEFYYSKR